MNMSVVGETLLLQAEIVATFAHKAVGQKRKYTGDDYIVHPRAVVQMLKNAEIRDWRILAAAWLHDVVEDTQVTDFDIHAAFGSQISYMVAMLTNVPVSAGNRKARFEINAKRLKNSPPAVKSIKIADLIDNTRSIVDCDPAFAKLYLSEKRQLLERSLIGGNEHLWNYAMMICQESERKLEEIEKRAAVVAAAC